MVMSKNITNKITKHIKIAVMGCIVNGPGEAKEADIGLALGIDKAAIFLKGKVIRRVEIKDLLFEFENELKKLI